MSKLEAMLEAERRGILPPDKVAALAEARRRGLISAPDGMARLSAEGRQERARLQDDLDRNLAAADEAGKRLRREEIGYQIARPVLRGAVDLADGVFALPRLVASVPGAIYNAFTDKPVGLPIQQSFADLTPQSRNALAARNDTERLTTAVTRGMGGVLFGAGVGGALGATGGAGSTVANIGQRLSAKLGLQTAGSVTGAASSEAVRRSGGGPVAQIAAGIAGGAAPSLAQAGASALTRAAVRGGEAGRQAVARNIDSFERAGTTPSVGQVTEGRFSRAAETLLSRVPGAAGRMAKKANAQAGEIGARIDRTARSLSSSNTAEQAGRRIVEGVKGKGGFIERTKSVQEGLYNKLDQMIRPDTPTPVSNTQTALKELTKVDPGAARTTGNLVNSKIKQIADDLAADAQTGTVPYSALKSLRTRVGEMLDDSLVADVPQKQLRRLYASLSQDLGEAAKQNGAPAQLAWTRANNYTRARAQRLEVLDDVVGKAGGAEAVFKAATSGTAEGATRLRSVMQSLDTEGQKAISATVLRRLGRAINSQQDEVGDKFSTETLLTNWNKLSNEAKSALFNRYGAQYRRDMDALSKVAANLREGSNVFKNPSGTAQGGTQIATAGAAGAALSSLAAGNAAPAVGLATALGGANLGARLMTNPRFVRWLAVSTKLPESTYTSQLNQLTRIGQREGDASLVEAAEYLRKQREEKPKAANNERNDQPRRQ